MEQLERTLQGSYPLELGGHQFHLLPEHAAWSPVTRTVFLADLHFGKEATFRRMGLPIPDVLDRELNRLDRLIETTQCERMIVLGDLLHARMGRSPALLEDIADWRAGHAEVDITLVRGNHDKSAGDPPEHWHIDCVDEPFAWNSLTLRHKPDFESEHPTLAGHWHPKYRLRSRSEVLRLPCFWHRRQTLVLPAFSSFVDHGQIQPEPGDQIYVAAGEEVIAVG